MSQPAFAVKSHGSDRHSVAISEGLTRFDPRPRMIACWAVLIGGDWKLWPYTW